MNKDQLDQLNISNTLIQQHIPIQTKEKAFKINLPLDAYYHAKYDLTGRFLMVYNSTGSYSMFDVKTKQIFFDCNLEENIYDGIFLHNEMYTALSQKKALFIYNHGQEIQCIREMRNIQSLDFLNYHFLITGLTKDGMLKYFDSSIGKLVSTINLNESNNGDTNNLSNLKNKSKDYNNFSMNKTMTINKSNAIVHVGNHDGTVTLYKPSEKNYLMKILCHRSSIKNIQIDNSGDFMITNGCDNTIRVWDIRNTYSPVTTINTKNNFEYMKLSQNNLLGLGSKNNVTILKNITRLGSVCNINDKKDVLYDLNDVVYMKENVHGSLVKNLDFCPFEDILTVSHTKGFSNLIVPGSGDPNFDPRGDSPFRSRKQRQNLEVKRLLEKIPYNLISLDNGIIGTLFEDPDDKKIKSDKPIDMTKKKKTALERFYEK